MITSKRNQYEDIYIPRVGLKLAVDGEAIRNIEAIAKGAKTAPYITGTSIVFCATKYLLPSTTNSTTPATKTARQILNVCPRLENSPFNNTASPNRGSARAKSGAVIQ